MPADLAHLAPGAGIQAHAPGEEQDEAHPDGRGQPGIHVPDAQFRKNGCQGREYGRQQGIDLPHDAFLPSVAGLSRRALGNSL